MTTPANMKENSIFLSLGSNLGNRAKNLQTAIDEISKFADIKSKSSIYETSPMGYKDQGYFLNQVIEVLSALTPLEMIFRIEEIEHKMGRVREIENGPRPIDIDILFYGETILNNPNLQIPHPGIEKRKFVLIPLEEISPEFKHPISKKTIKQLNQFNSTDEVKLWT